MYVNLLLLPTLALALGLYWLGVLWMARLRMRSVRVAAFLIAVLLAIPGLLFTLYYTHRFDDARWFYEFRTVPGTELTAAGVGLLAGLLQRILPQKRYLLLAYLPTASGMMLVWLLVPYLKMLTTPANLSALQDSWRDGVCIQSVGYTCGPASAATLARAAGVHVTERELARESYTSLSGTENWYLARALRRRGLPVHYQFTSPMPDELPYPAIAGVRLHGMGGAGHFIVVLGKEGDSYRIGDPLFGTVCLTPGDHSIYYFTGFFLRLQNKPTSAPTQ